MGHGRPTRDEPERARHVRHSSPGPSRKPPWQSARPRAKAPPELALGLGGALAALAVGISFPEATAEAVRFPLRQLSLWSALALGGATALVWCALGLTGMRRSVEAILPGLRRLARAPSAIALPVIVGVSAAVRIALADGAALPRVFGDELVHSSLGKSVALTGDLLVRGERELGYGMLYPIVVSPAYAFAADGVSAFVAVKGINAIVMSLVAVPAYFLATQVVSHGWSLLVALLSVAVPAMNLTAVVMTESLFYPGFVLFALVLVRALERPTIGRQLIALAVLLGLVTVRGQALALVPAVATAFLLYAARSPDPRTSLRRFDTTWLGFTALIVLALLVWVVTGRSPLGAYSVLARGYSVLDVVTWASWNLAALGLSLGLVALAALPIAVRRLLQRDASDGERAFASVAVALVSWTLFAVALLSASPYGLDRLHERNLFYVAPLVLVCFCHWLSAGLPRPRIPAAAGLGAVLALGIALPPRFVLEGYSIDAPTMTAWNELRELSSLPPRAVLVGSAVLGAAILAAARRPAIPLVTVAAAFLGVSATTDWQSTVSRPETQRLAWVDHALPGSGRALLVHIGQPGDVCPSVVPRHGMLEVWTEFFNLRVVGVAHVYSQIETDGLGSTRLTLARDGTLRRGTQAIRAEYVVLDARIPLQGSRMGTFDGRTVTGAGDGTLALWRAASPVRLALRRPKPGESVRSVVCSYVAAEPENELPPSVLGTMVVGQVASAHPGVWSGFRPMRFSYRWLRCNREGGACVPIRGADARTYRLTARDARHRIRFTVSVTNFAGARTALSTEPSLVTKP